jgi:hypothetical protein
MHNKKTNKKLASDYNKNPHARHLSGEKANEEYKKLTPDGAAFVPSLFEFWKVSVIAVFVVQIIQVGSLTA